MTKCSHKATAIVQVTTDGKLLLTETPEGWMLPWDHCPEQRRSRMVAQELLLPEQYAPEDPLFTGMAHQYCADTADGEEHWHYWSVYVPQCVDTYPVQPGQKLFSKNVVTLLARRSRKRGFGLIDEEQWQKYPGLHPMAVHLLKEIGYLE
jgi:hypothetical protein